MKNFIANFVGLGRKKLLSFELKGAENCWCAVLAADLWSGDGDSDSAHKSSLTSSVGVWSQVRAWTPDNHHGYDTVTAMSTARLQRPNTARHYLPPSADENVDDDDDDDNVDTCYRTLADNVTAGAYRIKPGDAATVLSC